MFCSSIQALAATSGGMSAWSAWLGSLKPRMTSYLPSTGSLMSSCQGLSSSRYPQTMGMNILSAGGGPQEPELQVQKSSGGDLSWLGVTRQLYHQLTLLKALRSPQWKFSPGGIQRPFFPLLPCRPLTRQLR